MSWYIDYAESSSSMNHGIVNESVGQHEDTDIKELNSSECKFREFICGEEALRVSPTEPYCIHRPIRRGHLNISQHYPMQQVFCSWFVLSYCAQENDCHLLFMLYSFHQLIYFVLSIQCDTILASSPSAVPIMQNSIVGINKFFCFKLNYCAAW